MTITTTIELPDGNEIEVEITGTVSRYYPAIIRMDPGESCPEEGGEVELESICPLAGQTVFFYNEEDEEFELPLDLPPDIKGLDDHIDQQAYEVLENAAD